MQSEEREDTGGGCGLRGERGLSRGKNIYAED